jgi:inorganic triphosphatase YgiF
VKYETETKFIIIHKNPETIVNELTSLRQLNKFSLIRGEDQQIKDIYFDTRDAFLQKRKLALRFRMLNQQRLITLKGKTRIQYDGAIQRLEIEKNWSQAALAEITGILREEGLDINWNPQDFSLEEPSICLQKMNLNSFHERRTQRIIRWIVDPENNEPIVELAFDTAIYRFGKDTVIHYEVELEEKSAQAGDVIPKCAQELHALFPNQLQAWTVNKLALGIILEKLIHRLEFQKLIDSKNHITFEGYQQILKES